MKKKSNVIIINNQLPKKNICKFFNNNTDIAAHSWDPTPPHQIYIAEQRQKKVYNNDNKNQLCYYYENDGFCKNMENCWYAHGFDELNEYSKNIFRTKRCTDQNCSNGNSCHFAHSDAELNTKKILTKTKLCKFFTQSECKNGDNCKYIHSENDLNSTLELINDENNNTNIATHSWDPMPQRKKIYNKNQLCYYYENDGFCKNMENCWYAHGFDELNEYSKNIFRTKRCTDQNCSNGNSCHFAHSEAELNTKKILTKTKLCKFFTQSICKNGDNCKYAHGEDDLNNTLELVNDDNDDEDDEDNDNNTDNNDTDDNDNNL